MNKVLSGAAVLLLAASPALAQGGLEVGLSFGAAFPASGDIGVTADFDTVAADYNDFFDPGFSLGAYVAGPISGAFGWRAELGWDRTQASDDLEDAVFADDLDFNLDHFRFMGGIMLAPWSSEGSGRPYGFVTLGGVNSKFRGDDVADDSDGETNFGMSFGGGYNWKIGDAWGVGADVHVTGVFLDGEGSDTLWYWTPSGQLFFSF